MRNLTILFSLLLFSAEIFSQQNWQTYPYSPSGSVLNFPQDDGYHSAPNTTTEWWYVNMTLIGSAPAYKKYSVMLCYFRFANMRIFNIADETNQTFNNDVLQQPFNPSAFIPQLNHWEFTYSKPFPNPVNDISKWTYLQDGKPYSYTYHAEDPSNNKSLDVTVVGNRPPLVVGGSGYVALGDKGDSSYYYSYTNMKVTGTIKYNGITDSITSGIAWIDRQYGPFTVGINPNNLYEWFSLQLDEPGTVLGQPQSPAEFNIWQIFSDTNSVPYKPEWRLVSGIYPDDSQDTTSNFIFERTGYWYDASEQRYYSQGWRFINPQREITVDLDPPIKNQLVNVNVFRFWEGGVNLKGVIGNRNVDGVGFAELVAGHKFQIVEPSAPTGLSVSSNANHYSLSWNASVAGTYPIGGYRVFRSKTNDGHWKYIATTTNLFFDDYSASPDTAYYYTVTSFDNQTATSASKYATAVLANPLGNRELIERKFDIEIYPNPNDGKFVVQITNPNEFTDYRLQIINVLGEEIFSEKIRNQKLEIRNFKTGIYILKLSYGNETFHKKIVVAK